MIDDVSAIIPHAVVTQIETPSPVVLSPGDTDLPAPTAEQASTADSVCASIHPAATLLGVLSSAMLLRDVAIDTFDTSGEEEEAEEKPDEGESNVE